MSEEKPSFTERVTVAGKELLETLQKLISEGNAKAIILWSEDDKKLLEIPLTAGVVVGGAAVILAPFLVAIGVIAATVKKVRIEIVSR